tara:strand:- start:1767 stop:1949 length:183 start_codon:yes stop_codon:yes gene_type:complete
MIGTEKQVAYAEKLLASNIERIEAAKNDFINGYENKLIIDFYKYGATHKLNKLTIIDNIS